MGIINLKTCCCCCDLKIGVLIIGILGLLGGIFMTAAPFTGDDHLCTSFYYSKCADLNGGEKAGITLYNLITIFVIVLMMYGSEKNNHALMVPMIVMYLIGMIWMVVNFLLMTIVAYKVVDATFGTINLIIGGLVTALLFYFWMVIYSRYKEIKSDQMPLYPRENQRLYP